MLTLFEDLRFTIGLFFGIISLILIMTGLISSPPELGFNLNLIVGVIVGCFSTVMMSLGVRALKKQQPKIRPVEG